MPSRPELVELLDEEALLPAIVFIFSRVGCDAAVRQLLASRIRLTSRVEEQEIAAIIERHVAGLSDDDLQALDYDRFAEALGMGVAAHHAGMLPTFKECVEEAFVRGLIKVVFATETLALGINMPARSVVLEKLVKFDGETHADVTPGEYTQLTVARGGAGSMSKVTRWCSGSPASIHGRWLAWPRAVPIRCGPPSPRHTTWQSIWWPVSDVSVPAPCSSNPLRSSSQTARWSGRHALWQERGGN